MRSCMASEKKKPHAAGGKGSAESRTGLDDVLGSLFERGLLRAREESRVPDSDSVDEADLERRRKDVLRAGLRVLFQSARVPMRDVWFGQWLNLVRSRSNVRDEEVSDLIGMDVLLWRTLETKPLQVTGLQPEVVVTILDLFTLPLPAAEACMRKGLLQGPSATVFARTTAAVPDVGWKGTFGGLGGTARLAQAQGAQAALDRLVKATRQLLEAKDRTDLLDESTY